MKENAEPSESVKTFVSLALFIHLFCVAVVLSSNFSPSPLQERLVSILSPYTKSLHLDPNFVPYHLTSGESNDRLHQWIVSTSNGDVYRYPDREWRGGFQRRRWDMMARVAAYYSETDADDVPAELARGVARHAIAEHKIDKGQRLFVRCVRHLGERPISEIVPPESESRDLQVSYEADAWINLDGEIRVMKRSPTPQSALPRRPTDQGN
jgi:hypothetical protein